MFGWLVVGSLLSAYIFAYGTCPCASVCLRCMHKCVRRAYLKRKMNVYNNNNDDDVRLPLCWYAPLHTATAI